MSHIADVLVAEDDLAQLQGLAAILRYAGFEVYTAGNGPEAIELGLRERPGAVICDWNLGAGPDGAEVVRRLKADNPRLLTIFITGNDLSALRATTSDIGDVCYFAKPVSPQRLVDILSSAASPSHLQDGCGLNDRR